MSALLISMPLPDSVRRLATEPTIVTSSPSSTHTVPSPTITLQWNRDQGSRSSRAGIWVRTVLPFVWATASTRGPPDAPLPRARSQATVLDRGRDDALALRALRGSGWGQAVRVGGARRPLCEGVQPGGPG